jgi:glycosyltransferase involved in cell wall biosynthesis
MLRTTENGQATLSELEAQVFERRPEEHRNGHARLLDELQEQCIPLPPEATPERRPTLAMFCYEDVDSAVGRFTSHLAAALVRRNIDIHIFSRRDFDLDTTGIACHALGECDGDDVVAQVEEFGGRACNAFLKLFPGSTSGVTLLGLEWSSIPVLTLLRGLKKLDALLSLHSLERQRSDMTSDVSQQIDEIERTGLHEAKSILVHNCAVAEVVKTVLPECAERITPVRERFPVDAFDSKLDPGEVKARYQIGPVDPTVVYVGDLSERYGPELLIKALPAALKNNKQVRLVVVGEGTLYWPMRVYTRYLLLEHAVRFAGHVEGQALYELIQAADVVAVPSREATPWWPIQAAWAARRPLVATHHAAPGLVEHERDGLLVYPSENSCVWGIERVLYDNALRPQLIERGYAKVEERFGWGGVAAQMEELMGVAAAR